MTTIDNIMDMSDKYAISVADAPHHPTPLLRAMAVEKIERAREALRIALTEALDHIVSVNDMVAQPSKLNWIELVDWWESGGEQLDALKDIVQRMVLAAQVLIPPDSRELEQAPQPAQRTAGCTLCGYCAATGEKIQAAKPAVNDSLTDADDFEIRGKLAAGLQCRNRLTGAEAENLVSFFANNVLAAQPVREPLQDALTWELWLNAVDTANNTGRLVAYTYKDAIERAHNIRGEN